MNIKQLQFAVHVAGTHSFSRAAELCFATQPTLSNAISQLEDELGGRLFNRTTRRVDLTPFGEYMLPRFKDVLLSLDELSKAAESFHNPTHKILRIGFSPLVDMQRLDHVLAPFRQANPDITIFFKECFIDELAERLSRGQIDVQILPTTTESEREHACLFYRDSLHYLPAADDNQATNHLSFKITDLPATRIILTGGGCGLNAALSTLLKSQGVELHAYAGQALTYQVIEDWVSLGIGAGILPKAKISPDNMANFPLFIDKDEPACFSFEWSWQSESTESAHIQSFIDYIRTTVPALVSGQAETNSQQSVG
ncbi:MAG: LysR family transcriptional regulator [Candidatus Thiodiazotropha taylori]|nr:LysR family transcriptional regulator [Candidatus Thiodiazotropha taylori]MCW4226279.1 LysR family transcriptional regulator [Candidatus Thiodiazotropha endolucinida]MCG7884107.1 LysR family transcriptional regulator [Candidatus Thiodiazotropha taylori]MCG7887843.1 LysR family transcriptional regulator [Candidatus Thiodiazotropha taylori]MCG7889872.1 LysR family transcriptional regulator [Candidatus Thiodiazotropha taylori]